MVRRMSGIALILLGTMVIIVCLAADDLGLGAAPEATGYKQVLGVAGGFLIQLVGIVLSQVELLGKGAFNK